MTCKKIKNHTQFAVFLYRGVERAAEHLLLLLHIMQLEAETRHSTQGELMRGLQPSCLSLPGMLVLDPSRRSSLASLMSTCCIPGFCNITQQPVILEAFRSYFVPCTVCTCAKWIYRADRQIWCHLSTLWMTAQRGNPGREQGLI